MRGSSSCVNPGKFYVDCSSGQTFAQAVATCLQHGMTLLNLSNTSTLSSDVNELNKTLLSLSCNSNFWFASGNGTGYVTNANTLVAILESILDGVLNLLGNVLGLVGGLLSCLLLQCPTTTTPTPITSAIVICTRQTQQHVIRKCEISNQADMKIFNFNEAPMYGGILYSIESRSRTACSAQCSKDNQCNGVTFINNNCTLYM